MLFSSCFSLLIFKSSLQMMMMIEAMNNILNLNLHPCIVKPRERDGIIFTRQKRKLRFRLGFGLGLLG